MSLGIIILAHTRFDRVRQLIRNWIKHDCRIVVHIDSAVSKAEFQGLKTEFQDNKNIRFCVRHRCEWGTWGLVAAALTASEELLSNYSTVDHVLLTSGSCLPIRPVGELISYLKLKKDTDFIESVNTLDVRWTVGGLQEERFSFYYPFAWKRQRRYFDWAVRFQRKMPRSWWRTPPSGLDIHLGSQWWCLSRDTLDQILSDRERSKYERYFESTWIPDESFFQSMARKYSKRLESKSLTLSKFDYFGRPHVFYDDHRWLLKKTDHFLARKIWPDANALYDEFLGEREDTSNSEKTSSAKIDRIFDNARKRRMHGRPGLYMISRFPTTGNDAVTARPYLVLSGFEDLFKDFSSWLSMESGARVHGHVFSPKRVEYAERESHFIGALSDSAWIRDYNPAAFLTSLIWNARGENQVLQIGPRDSRKAWKVLASDKNASIHIITGAFFLGLFLSNSSWEAIKLKAARLQKREDQFVDLLSQRWVSARVSICTLGEFLTSPKTVLQEVVDAVSHKSQRRIVDTPKLRNFDGFAGFLQSLRNSGINPYMVGDLPFDDQFSAANGARENPFPFGGVN